MPTSSASSWTVSLPFSGLDGPALRVTDAGVRYGNAVALRGIDFEVGPGTLIGVIGPNGAGKSTLVKALCGRVPMTSGEVMIGGTVLKRGQRRQHLLGLVPQSIGLYPHLTGRENLDVFARVVGLSGDIRTSRIEAALRTVHMEDRADRRVEHMSGGMQRRINVAAAILHEPPMVIFDEPTAGVDIPARDVIHTLARELADRGHAVMLITHELEQAEMICDRVLVLEKGRQVEFAKPGKLLADRFGDIREVVLRYRETPDASALAAMEPFGFKVRELPTIWSAMTQATQVSFVSAFMAGLPNRDEIIREVTVRRPGLSHLIHQLESA